MIRAPSTMLLSSALTSATGALHVHHDPATRAATRPSAPILLMPR